MNHKAHGLPAGIFRPPIGKWIKSFSVDLCVQSLKLLCSAVDLQRTGAGMDWQPIRAIRNLCWNGAWLCACHLWKRKEKGKSCAGWLLCECNDFGCVGCAEEVRTRPLLFSAARRSHHDLMCLRTHLVASSQHFNTRFNFRFPLRMVNQSELPVYNYIYDTNNLTWGKYMRLVRKGLYQPLDKAFWYFVSKRISAIVSFR